MCNLARDDYNDLICNFICNFKPDISKSPKYREIFAHELVTIKLIRDISRTFVAI